MDRNIFGQQWRHFTNKKEEDKTQTEKNGSKVDKGATKQERTSYDRDANFFLGIRGARL